MEPVLEQKLLVYVESRQNSTQTQSTIKHLQQSATIPVQIHVLEPDVSSSSSPWQRWQKLAQQIAMEPPQTCVFVQEGIRLSVGWEQSFLRAFHSFEGQCLAVIPNSWPNIDEQTASFSWQEEERNYLCRLWSLHTAGWAVSAHAWKESCIGWNAEGLRWLRMVPEMLSGEAPPDIRLLRLVDVFCWPEKNALTNSLPISQHGDSVVVEENNPKSVISFSTLQPSWFPHKKPTLGLAMIAKNEATRLEHCLRSVQSWVEQVVVGDTGSTDDTVVCAQSCGADILHIPWQQDFAAARNAVMARMQTDWILILDPDEEIAFSDVRKLKEALSEPDAWAYELEAQNYYRWNHDFAEWVTNDGIYPESQGYAGWIPSYSVRLVRNDRNIRYHGRLHELLDYSLWQWKWPKLSLDIPVHHYGYAENPEYRAKTNTYLEVAQKKAEESSMDQAKAWWEWGVLLAQAKKNEEAIACYIESVRRNRLFVTPYLSMLGPLLQRKAYAAATKVCQFLSGVIRNSVVVRVVEEIQRRKQAADGNNAFLEEITAILATVETEAWKTYQWISQQSQEWSKKRQLQMTYQKQTRLWRQKEVAHE